MIDYRLDSQIQQPRTNPILFVRVLSESAVPVTLASKTTQVTRFCFVDLFNNIKIVECSLQATKSFLITKFNTKAPEAQYTSMAENPVTGHIYCSDSIGRVHCYKVSSKAENCVSFKPHTGRVNSLTFDRQGIKMASASNDKTVKVYDVSKVRDPKKGASFIASFVHSNHVKKVLFGEDALFSIDGKSFRGFDVETKKEVINIDCVPKQPFVDFHLVGKSLVLLIDEKAEFRLFDLRSNELVRAFSLPNLRIERTQFSEQTMRLAVYGQSIGGPKRVGSVHKFGVFNVFGLTLSKSWEIEPKFSLNDVDFGMSGKLLVAATKDDGLMVFLSTEPESVFRAPNETLALSPIENRGESPVLATELTSKAPTASCPVKSEQDNITLERSINALITTITASARSGLSDNDLNRVQNIGVDVNFGGLESAAFNQPILGNPSVALRPEDYLVTGQPLDMTELSQFIKDRSQLLSQERNDSNFSFKVTAEPQPLPAALQERKCPECVAEEQTENVFINVLGKEATQPEGSPITIIDEHFV